jgi:hypothetical protein
VEDDICLRKCQQEEPAVAKAKTVVGSDVHATKTVAALLDVETG